jgi:YXWGXW repeat-containing protein
MKMKRSFRGLALGVLMFTISVLSLSAAASAEIGIGIGISVRIGPPALPVYAQPICPGPGYLWTPGYWAWNDDGGYYWVPGTWVVAPVGMLWTPGYWGFAGGVYGWHPGYWGPHVGFYGGVNYGFGYGGVGFFGGEWRGGAFFYNRAVLNVNVVNVRNVYSRTVIVNNVHTSFNGPGGIEARPTPQEEAYGREQHIEAVAAQREHERAASQNRALFASANHGRPEIAATGRPGEFSGAHVERASAAGEAYREPRMSPAEARGPAAGNRGVNDSARRDGNSNDHAANRDTGNRESSRDHAKPSKQEKQAQKRADKQAKAEQKRNDREQR